MEKDAAQPISQPLTQTSAVPQVSEPIPQTSQNLPTVPKVDLKAPLKIESEKEQETVKIDYGERLFVLGILFCVVIVIAAAVVVYFWTQNKNQIHKPITVEQINK